MKNTVAESVKVLVTKSYSFKDFNLVVATFGKAVSYRSRKRIKNTGHPVNHSLSALFKALNPTVKSTINPLGKCGLGRNSVFAIKDFQEILFVKMGGI